jgi:hypothetical protein
VRDKVGSGEVEGVYYGEIDREVHNLRALTVRRQASLLTLVTVNCSGDKTLANDGEELRRIMQWKEEAEHGLCCLLKLALRRMHLKLALRRMHLKHAV